MANYATQTKVSVASSKAEIENTLNRFGIHNTAYGTIDGTASVMFDHQGQPYAIRIQLPSPDEERFWQTPGRGLARTQDQAHAAWEQECRVKWRELALLIKAKLVAISNDAVSFANEFLAYAMLPDRSTLGELADKQLKGFIERGEVPALMPGRRG